MVLTVADIGGAVGPDLTGIVEDSLPYRYQPPYSFGGWRSGTGECIPAITSREDGCWP